MSQEEPLIISKELKNYNFQIDKNTLKNYVQNYRDKKDLLETYQTFEDLIKEKNIEELLKTNSKEGIKQDSINDRIEKFDSNEQEKPDIKTIKELILEALDDLTLKILIVSSFISIVINYITEGGYLFWIEGFSILLAVIISCSVQTINDYQKEKEFLELNKFIDGNKNYKVLRNNKINSIHKSKLLVGDILIVENGMEIPCDSILIQGNEIKADESSLTGESHSLRKETFSKISQLKIENNKNLPTNILFEGTNILTGLGKLVVVCVGKNSSLNYFKEKLKEKDEELTPLQLKLENIARNISIFGLYSAIIIFLILVIKLAIHNIYYEYIGGFFIIKKIFSFFIISIAILVVAIPEGLPLAVTISLAFSIKKMMKDNNLVKKLQACETMGGANIICSDKTGTLTKNEMHWVKFYSNNIFNIYNSQKGYEELDFKSEDFKDIFIKTTILNSLEDVKSKKGNPTELALLKYFDSLHYDIEKIKNDHDLKYICPFSSDRKRMSSVYKINNKYYVFMKGASELMVNCCNKQINFNSGNIENINYNLVLKEIENMAKISLRTIGILYKVLDEEPDYSSKDNKNIMDYEKDDFTLIGIAGIKDVVRPEVSDAIKLCHRAGIEVKMVTGDNKITAKAIAKEINIISKEDKNNIVLDGKEFNDLVGGLICKLCEKSECKCENKDFVIKNNEKFKEIAYKLKVLSRSRPEDKNCLVIGLKNLNNVVAVTGDGTNDSIALKKADVGFAMNITGTDLAKQSADILILDDNFYSIVQSVKWGRNIYDSIKKFLQFQLTVNVVAVITTFISSCIIDVAILNAVQMLWVNLIMDTLASLALSTEPPTENLLYRPPYKKNESMVTKKMLKHIIVQGIYQTIVILIIVFYGQNFLPEYQNRGQNTKDNLITQGGEINPKNISPSVHFTYIFNIFVVMQIFNFIAMRKLNDEINIFEGILKSNLFIIVWVIIVILQIIFVSIGGKVIKVVSGGLDFNQWLICILFGLLGLLVNLGTKYLDLEKYFPDLGSNEISEKDLMKKSSLNIKRSTNKRISKMKSLRNN